MADKKRKYIVTEPGVQVRKNDEVVDCSVGDTVELTDAQALARVNKVELADKLAASRQGQKKLADLQKQVETLQGELDAVQDAGAVALVAALDERAASDEVLAAHMAAAREALK